MDSSHNMQLTIKNINAPVVVQKLRGHESLTSSFEFDVEFLIQSHNNTDDRVQVSKRTKSLLCEPASLIVNGAIYNAMIYSITYLGDQDGSWQQYSATLRPWFGFYTDDCDSQLYTGMSAPQIINSVLTKLLYANKCQFNLRDKYPLLERCTRYNESTYNFITRIAREAGIYYFFKNFGNDCNIIFSDVTSPSNVHELFLPSSPTSKQHIKIISQKSKVCASNVNFSSHQPLHDHSMVSCKVKPPESNSPIRAQLNLEDYANLNPSQESVARQAKNISQDLARSQIKYIIKSNHAGLHAGDYFTIAENFTDNDKAIKVYRVASIEHISVDSSHSRPAIDLMQNEYNNTITAYPADLLLTVFDEPINKDNPFYINKPIAPSIQLGKVTTSGNQSVRFKPSGCVSYQPHWRKSQTLLNNWAPVRQPWVGNKHGTQFMPRKDQEIVLMYAQGEFDNPVVYGALYNAQNTAPFGGVHKVLGIKSSTGHELLMDDKNICVNLHSSKDMIFSHQGDMSEKTGGDKIVNVSKGDYELTIGESLKITAKKSVAFICGNSQVKVTAGGIMLQADQVAFNSISG